MSDDKMVNHQSWVYCFIQEALTLSTLEASLLTGKIVLC